MDFDAIGMNSANVFAADAKLHVNFYASAVLNEAKTAENGGVPVYEDKPFIKIYTPGDQYVCIDRPAIIDARHPNADNKRFAKQWEAFQRGEKEQTQGTPMKDFPVLVESQRKTLAYLEIHTVEQLADVSDDACRNLPGGQDLKSKAKAWLASKKDAAHTLKQQAELDKQNARLAELEAALAELRKQPKVETKSK